MNIFNRLRIVNTTNCYNDQPELFIDFFIYKDQVFTVPGIREKWTNVPQYRWFTLRLKFFKYGVNFELRLNKTGKMRG